MSKPLPETAVIRGRQFLLSWQKEIIVDGESVNGACDSPSDSNPALYFCNDLTGQKELEIYIHECLHAALWDIDEQAVTETAHDIAHLLTRLGYQR